MTPWGLGIIFFPIKCYQLFFLLTLPAPADRRVSQEVQQVPPGQLLYAGAVRLGCCEVVYRETTHCIYFSIWFENNPKENLKWEGGRRLPLHLTRCLTRSTNLYLCIGQWLPFFHDWNALLPYSLCLWPCPAVEKRRTLILIAYNIWDFKKKKKKSFPGQVGKQMREQPSARYFLTLASMAPGHRSSPGEVQRRWEGLAAAVAAARVNSVKVEGLTVMLRRQKHHRLSWQEARRG